MERENEKNYYKAKYFLFEYESEYLNGQRHGKGREYHCGQLVFEGEYLNGKRSGKGKKYG